MNETVNQAQNGTAAAQQEERMFTQAEVNAIVADRLTRERAKYADYDNLKAKAAQVDEADQASKAELEAANARADGLQKQLDEIHRASELRSIREKVAAETGVPVNLLTFDTEEDCTRQAAEIRKFSDPPYPNVRDGGDPTHLPATEGDAITRAFSRDNKHTPRDKYSY